MDKLSHFFSVSFADLLQAESIDKGGLENKLNRMLSDVFECEVDSKRFLIDRWDYYNEPQEGDMKMGIDFRPSYDSFIKTVAKYLNVTYIAGSSVDDLETSLLGRVDILKNITLDELAHEFPSIYRDWTEYESQSFNDFIKNEALKLNREDVEKEGTLANYFNTRLNKISKPYALEKEFPEVYQEWVQQRETLFANFRNEQQSLYSNLVSKRSKLKARIECGRPFQNINGTFADFLFAMEDNNRHLRLKMLIAYKCLQAMRYMTYDNPRFIYYYRLVENYINSADFNDVKQNTIHLKTAFIDCEIIKRGFSAFKNKRQIQLNGLLVRPGQGNSRPLIRQCGNRKTALGGDALRSLKQRGREIIDFYEGTDYFLQLGNPSLAGYIGYLYSNGILVLDYNYSGRSLSGVKRNAIYAIKFGNFELLKECNKMKLTNYARTGNITVWRIPHNDGWQDKVEGLITQPASAEDLDAISDFLEREGQARRR